MWHAHAGIQRADGLYGPLIVREYERKNPLANLYDFDLPEHVVTIIDWFNKSSLNKIVSNYKGADSRANSFLINGKARGEVLLNEEKAETPREVFHVEQGEKYRFRLIYPGITMCPIEVSIDNHNLTIIASDGRLLQPYEVTSLVMYPGERYDFILNANQIINSYWLKVKGLSDCSVHKLFELAILKYRGDAISNSPIIDFDYHNITRDGLVS
jgi:L-ascorbate oxidase